MLDWFKRNKLPEAWAVKQIDNDLLHLCGRGQLESHERNALKALQENRFDGAIRMHDSALVLNTRLFAALAPVEELTLVGQDQAEWQGKRYCVSWVPQRCWVYEGRLTVTHGQINGIPQRISVEDVSAIRDKAASVSHDESNVQFTSLDALEILPPLDKDPDRRR
ncbi:hypothetical protein IEI94_01170 [Halomonas sp. ML-15]|uniref:hypothetical protein n=1 Tax=Halomonas sp. ML-15 TaxID=2773305 RepID=UPI001746F5A4|nr:hypothetical protein [Halomonas sp. ML-15]MBD3894465.1 hypothetical protein [Halomonas sp. ML-15]